MYQLKQMFVFSPARVWRLKLLLKLCAVGFLVGVLGVFVYGGVAKGLEVLPLALVMLAIIPFILSAPWDEIDNQRMQEAHRQRQYWKQKFAKLDEDMRKLENQM